MTQTKTRTLHDKTYPNESPAYREARNALLEAEIELRRQVEAVAVQRRALPPGGAVAQDYVFEEGDEARAVSLSALFGAHDTLVAYSFMYGPAMAEACPSCSSMLDSLDRAARFVGQRASLVVIARSPIGRVRAFAKARGWRDLRLLSSAANSYNPDYHAETTDGGQRPVLNVFSNRGGTIRHLYATELAFAPPEPGQDPRHIDLIWPLWGMLDYTPEGRGDFRPGLNPG
jgi:predicted dithiol-disulfide oxidoreductase (DUF899 family)